MNDYICNITIPIDCPSPTSSHGTCRSYPLANVISYNRLSDKYKVFLTFVDSKVEPTTFYQAFKVSEWREAMSVEILALERNNT